MAQFRITCFFEVGGDGWSESIHSSLTNPVNVVTQAQLYATYRMQLAPQAVDLVHVRISDDQIFRDIYLDPFLLPLSGTYSAGPTVSNLPPWNALLLKMQAIASPTINRNLFLRGIPQDQVSGNAFTPTPSFLAALNAYRSYVTSGGFAIKGKDLSQVKQPIQSVSSVGSVVMGSAIPGLTGVKPNNQVEILGVPRSLVPIRTYLTNTFTDASHFTLRAWPATVNLGATGYFRLNLPVLNVIGVAVTAGITERRVGRPFGQPRGRRAVIR
jgi:hypothetical protein